MHWIRATYVDITKGFEIVLTIWHTSSSLYKHVYLWQLPPLCLKTHFVRWRWFSIIKGSSKSAPSSLSKRSMFNMNFILSVYFPQAADTFLHFAVHFRYTLYIVKKILYICVINNYGNIRVWRAQHIRTIWRIG